MVRVVLGILLLVFGCGSVLYHNNFQFSQLSTAEIVVVILSLIGALCFFFLKKKNVSEEDSGIHTMTFSLENLNPEEMGISLREGQQLYLRPYTGKNQDEISITDEKGNELGYVLKEYQDYILRRIESHRLTHTVIESIEEKPLGICSITVQITC